MMPSPSRPRPFGCSAFALALLGAASLAWAVPSSAPHPPSQDAAKVNAYPIFNAVHSAMRQWGSSLQHNGMSFFPATVPEGNLLYHGLWGIKGFNGTGLEWLAFEIEHASGFAISLEPPERKPSAQEPPERQVHAPGGHSLTNNQDSGLPGPSNYEQTVLGRSPLIMTHGRNGAEADEILSGPRTPNLPPTRGYLQTYRAARDLHLVYIDGMAAGKSWHGTTDSQDYLLLGWNQTFAKGRPFADLDRAEDLCALADRWAAAGSRRIDGFVRAEAGFEIIYCNFSDGGIELLTMTGSPFRNESRTADAYDVNAREWLRAAASRYHGHPPGRIDVDFSSMVSAFFYPFNLTNPDVTRPELPRVVDMTKDEWAVIRARLKEVVDSNSTWTKKAVSLPWQTVVDQIVGRYAARLRLLVEGAPSVSHMLAMVNTLLNQFIDYTAAERTAGTLLQCRNHYLIPVLMREQTWTPEDRAIFAAVQTVTDDICRTFLSAQLRLNATDPAAQTPAELEAVAAAVQADLGALMGRLRWSTWKQCAGCAHDEICFVSMFPWGSTADHFNPSCKPTYGDRKMFEGDKDSYWRPPF